MHGEQRLIIATCEKGTVEDVNDMKDIKAGLDKIARSILTSSTWRRKKFSAPRMRKVWPIRCRRAAGGWKKGAKERSRTDGEAQEAAHRHSARPEYLYVCAVV